MTERIFSDEALALAEQLCARLCHDLAGPVGAVATGAELLEEEGPAAPLDSEALGLLTASAAAAGQKLKFLRQAFGTASGTVSDRHLQDQAQSFVAQGSDLALHWRTGDAPDSAPWTALTAKLALNLLMIARDCLPRGGVVSFRAPQGPNGPLLIEAEGVGAQVGEAASGLLHPNDVNPGPKTAQGAYCAALAIRDERRINHSVRTGALVLTLEKT